MKQLIFLLIAGICMQCHSAIKDNKIPATAEYQCIPCGSDCDNKIHTQPGTCPQCKMELVERSTINFKTVKAADICTYLNKNPETVIIDVRTRDEFDGKADNYGALKNAMNVSIQELRSKLPLLTEYKSSPVLVYCSRSHRSPQAAYILSQNGFTNVTNMEGGISVVSDTTCKR